MSVGSLAHPMLEEHYIEWIEIIADVMFTDKKLKPGDKPEAFFNVTGKEVVAEYTGILQLHGLWKNNNSEIRRNKNVNARIERELNAQTE